MKFEVFEGFRHGIWIVEAINTKGEGEVLWAEFSGSGAQERAKEYAEWMNSKPEDQQLRRQYSLTVP
jgi:hypothetical protein